MKGSPARAVATPGTFIPACLARVATDVRSLRLPDAICDDELCDDELCKELCAADDELTPLEL